MQSICRANWLTFWQVATPVAKTSKRTINKKMARVQGVELEDLAWYPAWLREDQTDYLRFMMEFFQVFRPALPLLSEVVGHTGTARFTDLCSGGGGPVRFILQHFRPSQPVRFTLSDLYPNHKAFAYLQEQSNGAIDFIPHACDALRAPHQPGTILTLFNAFHHFNEAQAQAFLAKVQSQRTPLLVFEPINRSLAQVVVNVFVLTVFMWLSTPFVKPFRWRRMCFTYLLPLLPLCTLWDGLVSVARLYSPAHMQKMLDKLPADPQYYWRPGKLKHTFGKAIYLIGYPLPAQPTEPIC
jgi:hypothetical protein